MPPAYLCRGGEAEEILLPGLPPGAMAESEYKLRVEPFQTGDVILLISDGLPELANDDGKLLGYEAVGRCLGENATRSAAEILEAFLELGRGWSGRETYGDDVTVVVVRRV